MPHPALLATYLLTIPRRGRAVIAPLFAALNLWVRWKLSPKAY